MRTDLLFYFIVSQCGRKCCYSNSYLYSYRSRCERPLTPSFMWIIISEENVMLTGMLPFFPPGFCLNWILMSVSYRTQLLTVHCKRLGWRFCNFVQLTFWSKACDQRLWESLVFDSPTWYCSIRNPSQGRQQLWRPFPTMIHNVSVQ